MKVLLLILTTFLVRADDVQTAPSVDLQKYLGKWYEVASIPQDFQKQCVGNTTAEYSPADDNLIKVVNSCDTDSGERDIAEGRGKVVDRETNAKLKVTFVHAIDWVFTFAGDYWILYVDDDYSFAVVGENSRKYAWILSRSPQLPKDDWKKAVKVLKKQGYDTCKVLTSIQSQGKQSRVPLCKYP